MKFKTRTFQLYRYQLLPTQNDQLRLLYSPEKDISNQEELIRRKNEIFESALKDSKEFTHPRAELTHMFFQVDKYFVIKIGANRSLIRITKEFKKEELDNWPSVYVVINNDPEIQMMAVELESDAFYRTSTVTHILTSNLNKRLHKDNLVLEIIPTFVKNEFWRIVNANKTRVTTARFFMVSPNLAKISKNLELDLGELKNRINSSHTNISFNSPRGESLTLSEDDSFTQSLVGYASEGGGTIHLKVKNTRKLIKTEDSIKSTEIDEIYFSGSDVPEQLVKQLKRLLK